MKNAGRMLTLVALAGLACGPSRAAEQEAPTLTLTGENTVIKSYGEHYAAAWLQYYLIKCVARHPDAMKYSCYVRYEKGEKRIDRSAAPVFPISQEKELPADQVAIVVGTLNHLPAEYLGPDERNRLEQKRGSILVKRKGNVILLAKNSLNPWAFGHITTFLDKVCGIRLYAPSLPGQNEEEPWLSMPEKNEVTVGRLGLFMKPYFAKTAWSSGGHQRNVE
ncbi:MAG: hypothetical protein QF473_26520, partial [Planctomycetota bacterium]|nr:hypothetical protein [Planctomycetota bacterium]